MEPRLGIVSPVLVPMSFSSGTGVSAVEPILLFRHINELQSACSAINMT